MSVDRYFFKSRTPVTFVDVRKHERVGNEIYITMNWGEVKTFTYPTEKDAELEINDYLLAKKG
jgi:hypothetical protein